MSQGFTPSSGGFSGGQSGFGGGSQNSGFGDSGGFSAGSPSGASGSSGGAFGGSNQNASGSGFNSGSAPVSSSRHSSGKKRGSGRLQSAPLEWILPGLVLGLISIGLNAWITFGSPVATDTSFFAVAVIAWILAGILGVLSVGKYMATVNERKSTGFYTEDPVKKLLFVSAAVLLLIAVLWSAGDIALWAGKRSW
ncbi:hypothetical protein [Corynebacterium crudilactis]|uniref:Uncharacterized protein n=1 Tax=Corynebacterium crudilactis TaxID=1652495 RepID=A0A172QWA2_9CORY|nr:hypothetical protein [Corynebacterium crudilactis]ANE04900.1 hypothetical protein ccrud_12300 [Corynebacterium crudilactis]